MLSAEELHLQAMEYADDAFLAKKQGNAELAEQRFLEATKLESRAADLFPAEKDSEPTRSILYRSAASMAFHAKDYSLASQLVARGLGGFPPREIFEELTNLQEDIAFHKHISAKGSELSEDQLQMILYGEATGKGIIEIGLLLKRLEQLRTIFYRTVERLSNIPYRTSGAPSKKITDSYNLFLDAFIPGSFGVSLIIGEPAKQLPLFPENNLLPEKIESEQIIDEVLTCFELLQEEDTESLSARFQEKPEYLENFVGVARQMAPDGIDIKALGFSASSNGKERTVGLRKTKQELPISKTMLSTLEFDFSEIGEEERIQLDGVLRLADSLSSRNNFGQVTLVSLDNNKVRHSILVPLTQMQDVVQPYFEEYVTITVAKRGNNLYFEDILSADPPDTNLPLL